MPSAYLVSPSVADAPNKELALVPIETDGVYFLRELKRHLVDRRQMFPDSVYDRCSVEHDRVAQAHSDLMEKLPPHRYPLVVFAAAYQDGLIHGFGRIGAHRGAGDYSDPHHLYHLLNSYEEVQKRRLRDRDYWDVAYIEGYRNALTFLVLSAEGEPPRLPLYFAFGTTGDLHSLTALRRALRSSPPLHKGALRAAKKIVASLGSTELVPHHTPFL